MGQGAVTRSTEEGDKSGGLGRATQGDGGVAAQREHLEARHVDEVGVREGRVDGHSEGVRSARGVDGVAVEGGCASARVDNHDVVRSTSADRGREGMVDTLGEGALTGTAEQGGDAGVGGEGVEVDRRGAGEGEGLDAEDIGEAACEGVVGEHSGCGDHQCVASGTDDGVHRELGRRVDGEEVVARRIDEQCAQEVRALGDGDVTTAAVDGFDSRRVGQAVEGQHGTTSGHASASEAEGGESGDVCKDGVLKHVGPRDDQGVVA